MVWLCTFVMISTILILNKNEHLRNVLTYSLDTVFGLSDGEEIVTQCFDSILECD